MIQPHELKRSLPMKLSNGVISTTTKVWEILVASKEGNLAIVKEMVTECPELVYAQYNYTPPIHFAVREGHRDLVSFLLSRGAYSPHYKTYPFQDSLPVMAEDRGHHTIVDLLHAYSADNTLHKFSGDNGEILYDRTNLQKEFEKAVYDEDLEKTKEILQQQPRYAKDETYFWGEGILTFAAKENNRPMIDLLTRYGARVPNVLKWAQFYYLEHDDGASYMLDKGMNPNTMSWQQVTLLHDMAQKGNVYKAELLLQHGADINPIDDDHQSTPLGMAARWGNLEMVNYLIEQGSHLNKAGAAWATPLAWARKKGFPEIEEVLAKAGATL